MNSVMKDEIHKMSGVEKELASRKDQRVEHWFGNNEFQRMTVEAACQCAEDEIKW